MTDNATDLTVRKEITVEASREHAFDVFSERIGSWWPLAAYSIGSAEAETAVLEPRAGGRWYERGVDGSECDWGRVLAFEPHERLLLDWQIGADWRFDPDLHTEVEVRFTAEGPARTRVEFEHRGLEAYGESAQRMYSVFASPNGWNSIFEAFAAEAAADTAATNHMPDVDFELDTFTLVVLSEGPRAGEIDPEEAERLLGAHVEYTIGLQAQGHILAAGALQDQTGGGPRLTGLGFSRKPAAELRPLLDADPAVEAGLEAYQLVAYHTPAGALAFTGAVPA